MLRAMRYRPLRDLEDLIRYYAPARFLCGLTETDWSPDANTIRGGSGLRIGGRLQARGRRTRARGRGRALDPAARAHTGRARRNRAASIRGFDPLAKLSPPATGSSGPQRPAAGLQSLPTTGEACRAPTTNGFRSLF